MNIFHCLEKRQPIKNADYDQTTSFNEKLSIHKFLFVAKWWWFNHLFLTSLFET